MARINYERDLQANRHIANKKDYVCGVVLESCHSKPTQAQIRYYNYLYDLCIKNGIEAIPYTNHSRKSVSTFIKNMQIALRAAGIEINYNEQYNRYKFDFRGNVIDRTTGKIVNKRYKKSKTH